MFVHKDRFKSNLVMCITNTEVRIAGIYWAIFERTLDSILRKSTTLNL